MDVRIGRSELHGELKAMPSKSDVHRALICSAFSDGRCFVEAEPVSDDMKATMDCLNAAGAGISYDDKRGGFEVLPAGWKGAAEGPGAEAADKTAGEAVPEKAPHARTADCRESGSTLRFLIPVFAAAGLDISFKGRGRLPERPISVILDELSAHGSLVEGVRLPFSISGRAESGEYVLPGDISSQFVSGLLMAFPIMGGASKLHLSSELQSAAYVDMTIDTMQRFGAKIRRDGRDYFYDGRMGGPAYRSPGTYCCDGDWSNAAFFIAANALYGREAVDIKGLRADSLQGDRHIADIIRELSLSEREGRPGIMDASGEPDLVPITAAFMALSGGDFEIVNAGRLRIKESDRLHAMAEGLGRLGADIEEKPEGLVIRGKGRLRGGAEVSSFSDHRIAMALSIAALFCDEPVVIKEAESVAKSFPDFYRELKRLGGAVEEL